MSTRTGGIPFRAPRTPNPASNFSMLTVLSIIGAYVVGFCAIGAGLGVGIPALTIAQDARSTANDNASLLEDTVGQLTATGQCLGDIDGICAQNTTVAEYLGQVPYPLCSNITYAPNTFLSYTPDGCYDLEFVSSVLGNTSFSICEPLPDMDGSVYSLEYSLSSGCYELVETDFFALQQQVAGISNQTQQLEDDVQQLQDDTGTLFNQTQQLEDETQQLGQQIDILVNQTQFLEDEVAVLNDEVAILVNTTEASALLCDGEVQADGDVLIYNIALDCYVSEPPVALNVTGPAGPPGVAVNGTDGQDGQDGLNCWDRNSNGVCDLLTEDINLDGNCTALDCRGPQGEPGQNNTSIVGPEGPQGIPGRNGTDGVDGQDGQDGLNCWDLNANGVCDLLTEDINLDGNCTALDCQGPQGEPGVNGTSIVGPQGPQGEPGINGTDASFDTQLCPSVTLGNNQIIRWNASGLCFYGDQPFVVDPVVYSEMDITFAQATYETAAFGQNVYFPAGGLITSCPSDYVVINQVCGLNSFTIADTNKRAYLVEQSTFLTVNLVTPPPRFSSVKCGWRAAVPNGQNAGVTYRNLLICMRVVKP